jgi:hypothetical protein
MQALYADSPIDSSLFGLYIHQNYAQFCDTVDQCEGVAEWLSWVDWSGGEDVSLSDGFRTYGLSYILYYVVASSKPTLLPSSDIGNITRPPIASEEARTEVFQA